MKRSALGLEEVADWHTLAAAFRRAARGKGRRDEVRCFQAALPTELASLRADILDGSVTVGLRRRPGHPLHADAAAWRREQLRRHPLADALRRL